MDAVSQDNIRIIRTSQFGEIEITQDHIFNFPNGILGFEDLHEFILINDEETEPFKWLLSVEQPEIGFPLLSPWYIEISYDPGDVFNVDNQVVFTVITLEDEMGLMTANFKAPIILDVVHQTGQQIILPSDKFSPNHVISRNNNQV